jgi:hypothetical protein
MRVEEKFRNIWKVEFFSYYFLAPLWALTLYVFFLSFILPSGINNLFAYRFCRYALLVATLLSIIFFIFIKVKKITPRLRKEVRRELYIGDLTLLLLPLTSIMQYILNNLEVVSFAESVYLFFITSIITVLFVFIIPILFEKFCNTRTLMLLGLALVFLISFMPSLSRTFHWHMYGSLKIQMAVFTGIFLVSWLFLYFNRRNFLYLVIVVFFLTNSVTQLQARNYELPKANQSNETSEMIKLVGTDKPVITPNIYLLVYDSYVINEVMLGYGIDNKPQEQYLQKSGFTFYPQTYSLEASSILSMGAVFDVSLVVSGKDDIERKTTYGADKRKPISGDGVVQNLLKRFGYETYGVFSSDHFFWGEVASTYDYTYPNHYNLWTITESGIEAGILMGEFQFNNIFETMPQEKYIEEKLKLWSDVSEDPRFIYMHSWYPGHSSNTGVCRHNETEMFKKRLFDANIEMKQDVEAIIANDPEAIIIIAGDHGPTLTKNCTILGKDDYKLSEISRLDIQDRFATFLAIRWPTKDFEQYDDSGILQDMFPAIFSYIFKNPKLLKGKMKHTPLDGYEVAGATVLDGIIRDGIHKGEPLFISGKQ